MPHIDNEFEFDVNLKLLYDRLNPLRNVINLKTNIEEGYQTLRKKSLKYNSEEFLKQKNYIVYIFWKYIKDNKMYAIYIGKSAKGLRRTFMEETEKHIFFNEADELEVIPCLQKEISNKLEIKLISFFNPTYNIQWKTLNKEERIIHQNGI